jgi:hypothetical protein
LEWKFSRQDLRNILVKAGSIQINQKMAAWKYVIVFITQNTKLAPKIVISRR